MHTHTHKHTQKHTHKNTHTHTHTKTHTHTNTHTHTHTHSHTHIIETLPMFYALQTEQNLKLSHDKERKELQISAQQQITKSQVTKILFPNMVYLCILLIGIRREAKRRARCIEGRGS